MRPPKHLHFTEMPGTQIEITLLQPYTSWENMIRVQCITLDPFSLDGVSLLMDDMVDTGGSRKSESKNWDSKSGQDGAGETEPHSC